MTADDPFVLVEGEKAADAVAAAGLRGVGTVCGAPSTPGEAVIRFLATRPVALWADNDDVGRRHMARIDTALQAAGVPALYVVRWAEAPEHGDAADADSDTIRELVADAIAHHWVGPVAHPEPSDEPPENVSLAGADERPWPTPRSEADAATAVDEWVVDGVLRPGRLLVVAGSEGLGKSRVRTELAVRLATGHGALFNHYGIPGPVRVAWVDVENGEGEEFRREDETLARLGLTRADLGECYGVSLEGLSLTDDRDQAYVRNSIEHVAPAVVMFDTGSSMIGDEWGAELKAAIRFLRRLARRYGCAIVAFVHLTKPAKAAAGAKTRAKPEPNTQHGTALPDVMGQWTRQADTVALMADAGAGRILWTVRKRAPHSQLVLKPEGGTFDVVQVVAGEDLGVSTMERIHGCIATGYADAAAIATFLEVSERTVWRQVARLREAGRVAPDAPLRVSEAMPATVSPPVSGLARMDGAHLAAVGSAMAGGRTDTVSPPEGGDVVSVALDELDLETVRKLDLIYLDQSMPMRGSVA